MKLNQQSNKKILWIFVRILVIAFLNMFSIAIIVMIFLDPNEHSRLGAETFFQGLKFKVKAGLSLGAITGWLASFKMISFWYTQDREDKRLIYKEKKADERQLLSNQVTEYIPANGEDNKDLNSLCSDCKKKRREDEIKQVTKIERDVSKYL